MMIIGDDYWFTMLMTILMMLMMMIGDDSDGNDEDTNDDNLGESFVSDRLIAMVASETIWVPGGAQRLVKIFNA